jgi:3-oxoacyl-[acyl-carrier-protein] synthase II
VGRTRVVITGIGAVSPLGLTAVKTWEGLCAGRCGIRRITAFEPAKFDCQIAGEVEQYKIQQYVPKVFRKMTKLMSKDIELAVIAADEAVRDSGLITKAIDEEKVNVNPTRMAINLGAGLISCDPCELAPAVAKSITDGKFDIQKWGRDGLGLVTPLWLLKYLPNMLACHVGIIHDIQGPSNTLTCAEVSGHLSIAEAAEVIARGSADVALAGGAEAKVNPVLIMRQCLIKRTTSRHNDDPENACRPFDAEASGSVFGDGG